MSSPTARTPSAPPPEAPGFDFETWFELNRRSLLIVVAVVCAAIASLAIVKAQQRARKAEATKALMLVTPPTGPGEAPPPVAAEKLIALANQFAGTPAGEQALLLGSGRLFTEGKFAESQAAFSEFEEKYPENLFVGVAMLGTAKALEAQGKRSEALSAYDRAIVASGSEGFAAQARLAKARMLASAQPTEALVLYDEVLRGGAATIYGEQAAASRAQIHRLHPELVAVVTSTNSTVVRPTNATNLVPAKLP